MQKGHTIPAFDNVTFVYDDDFAFDISSEYGPILETQPVTLLTLLSDSIKIGGYGIPSGQFALQSFQIWQTTEPLEFSLDLKMFMESSGQTDIVEPAMTLMKYVVPKKSTNSKGEPGQGLIPPGPNLQSVLEQSGITKDKFWGPVAQKFMNNGIISSSTRKYGGLLDIIIGHYWHFSDCIITGVKPTFSEAKDEDYAPISLDLTVEFRTSEVATEDMLDKILTNTGKGGSKPTKK